VQIRARGELMQIEIVFENERLLALKDNWNSVYDADPDSQHFLSWTWVSKWFERTEFRWFILAARPSPGADYVGFFPLLILTNKGEDGIYRDEFGMGVGGFADYAGFICDPAHEEQVIPLFADHLLSRYWTKFDFHRVHASERRINLFLKQFPRSKFIVEKLTPESGAMASDNSIYPYLELPGDFDSYLAMLGSNRRADAKRVLRRLEGSNDLRITHVTAETFERDRNILLSLWEQTWGAEKGDKVKSILNNFRNMLAASFQTGSLFLPVLWRGETPIGALGTVIDERKRWLLFLLAGRDRSVEDFKPGVALHLHSIKWAIENKYKIYDFLMGNEVYKYRLGAKDRCFPSWTIKTRSGRNLDNKLELSSFRFVLPEALEAHRAGNLDAAERGYRQILAREPEHADALYLLAQLQSVRRDFGAAIDSYRSYLRVKPLSHEGWLKLGECLVAKGNSAGAMECFRKVMKLDPKNSEAARQLLSLGVKATTPAPAAGDKQPALDLEKRMRLLLDLGVKSTTSTPASTETLPIFAPPRRS